MMTAKMTANAEKRGKLRSGVKPSSMPEKHTSTGSMICAICDKYIYIYIKVVWWSG
jgi:hypothetical protein